MRKDLSKIINSTADFLTFTFQDGRDNLDVRIQDETIWMTQKLMAALFDTTIANINIHLKSIFATGELEELSVIKDFLITASDGKRYNTQLIESDFDKEMKKYLEKGKKE